MPYMSLEQSYENFKHYLNKRYRPTKHELFHDILKELEECNFAEWFLDTENEEAYNSLVRDIWLPNERYFKVEQNVIDVVNLMNLLANIDNLSRVNDLEKRFEKLLRKYKELENGITITYTRFPPLYPCKICGVQAVEYKITLPKGRSIECCSRCFNKKREKLSEGYGWRRIYKWR